MAKTNKQLKKERRRITKDVVLVLAVIAGLVSFFYNPMDVDMEFLRTIMGGVVGYYLGMKQIPLKLK